MSGRLRNFFSIFAIFALFIPCLAYAQEPKPRKASFDFEVRMSMWASPFYIQRIGNIPPTLRQLFPDEPIIPSDSTTPRLLFTVGWAGAPQFTFNDRWALRFGAWYNIPSSIARRCNCGNTREINMHGTTERGYGERLVYYATLYRPQPRPGAFSEIELRRKSGHQLILGYLFNPVKIVLEEGTDTYDSLKAYERQDLASVDMHIPYFGVRWQDPNDPAWPGFTIFIGPVFNRARITPIARGIDFQFLKPGFVVGFNVSMSVVGIIREIRSQK